MTAPDHPGVIAPPPLLFLTALLAGVAVSRWTAWTVAVPLAPPVRVALGLALVLPGAALAVWAIRTMRRARTPVEPWRTPQALVTTGPFARSRNPIYVAMATITAGLAVALDALPALALLAPALLVLRQGVVLREERYLEPRFGDEYRAYTARVRRWL